MSKSVYIAERRANLPIGTWVKWLGVPGRVVKWPPAIATTRNIWVNFADGRGFLHFSLRRDGIWRCVTDRADQEGLAIADKDGYLL